MALAQLVVLFAQFFPRMGLASALVQKPVLSRRRRSGRRLPLGIAAGVLGGVGGLRWRLAPLVLGQPDPRS